MGEPAKFEERSALPAARALALNLVSKVDLMRLKVLARMHARGLPSEFGWSDLLQEAFARVLDGSRTIPKDVPTVAFLAEVMRSIKSEYWKRTQRHTQTLRSLQAANPNKAATLADSAPNPERMLIAVEEVLAIEKLFAGDAPARQVIAGLYDGLSPNEICTRLALSTTDYESIRKRIRRALLKAHLRNPQ